MPAMAVIFPTYLLCFPILVPMGLSKQANYSTIFGMIAQIAQLGILLLSSNLNVYTLCIASSVSEVLVFVFRAAVVIKHRDSIPHQYSSSNHPLYVVAVLNNNMGRKPR